MTDVEILVPLQFDHSDLLHAARAAHLGDHLFLLTDPAVRATERCAYAPGDVVRCATKQDADGRSRHVVVETVPEQADTVSMWLELHDSVLTGARGRETDVLLAPGYVHRWEVREGVRFGTGWTCIVRFRIEGLTIERGGPVDAGPLDGGTLETPEGTHANVIPVPLAATGPVRLWLDRSSGRILELSGDGIEVKLVGDPVFVEALPAELDRR